MVFLGLVACTASWAQIGQITNPGRVVDAQGQPLKNAMITYTDPAKRLNYDFSDASGNFGPAKISSAVSSKAVSSTVPSLLTDVSTVGSKVHFFLGSSQKVSIEISNMTGRRIATVFDKNLERGSYTIDLNGAMRSKIANNVYFVKIKANNESAIRKLVAVGNAVSGFAGSSPDAINPVFSAVAKKMAGSELRIGKTGYKPVLITPASATEDVKTITLVKINIESRVDSVMSKMSLDDKIMLMTEDNPDAGNPYKSGTGIWNAGAAPGANDFNSWNNNRMSQGLKIPGLSGYDCVHGYIGGGSTEGTMFPHNQAMGCIQDTTLIQMAGRVTAIESASRGVYWAFAPCVAVCRDEHWGRIYEGPGETPEICAKVGRNLILGMQGRDLSLNTSICATAKHFAGDGGTQGGTNAGNTVGPDAVLRAIHLPPYVAAIEAEVACVMPSFSNWNGVGSHANKPLLTDWLKTQQGFDGFVVGDWAAHTFQGGSDRQSCVNATISAGLDNPMSPGIADQTKGDIKNGNASGAISTDRINDACRRILRVLFRKGLFENYNAVAGYSGYFHGAEHKDVARKCVAASMVVLKNENNTLPLKKTQKIAVIGAWGNDVGLQCGGWTLGWQGAAAAQRPAGTTLFMSLQQQGSGNSVSFSADGSNIPGDAAVVVVCVGIDPAAEYTKTNDQVQLNASNNGKINDLMNKAKASNKPIVLVLYTDGPAVVTQAISDSKAVVCAWLGSPEGAGFGDILYGDVHPTGKLNHTWPATVSQIPINDGNMGDAVGSGGAPLFPLGHGLTY